MNFKFGIKNMAKYGTVKTSRLLKSSLIHSACLKDVLSQFASNIIDLKRNKGFEDFNRIKLRPFDCQKFKEIKLPGYSQSESTK